MNHRSIISSARVIGFIILVISIVTWRMWVVYTPHDVRIAVSMIFPHEVLVNLRVAILGQFLLESPSQLPWFQIPVFSILLAMLLFYGAQRLRDRGRKLPLQVACYILIVSIIFSARGAIEYHIKAMNEYRSGVASGNDGINVPLGLLNSPVKPSLTLLVLQLVILALYIAWGSWVILKLGKKETKPVKPGDSP